MSYVDPHGNERSGQAEADHSGGWSRHSAREERRPRARHADAAPDGYPSYASTGPAPRDWGDPSGPVNGHHGPPDSPDRPPPYPDAGAYSNGDTAAWPQVAGSNAETSAWPQVAADPPPPERLPRGRRRAKGRRARTTDKPAGSGRAGRNLPVAIGVGLGLAAAILVPLFAFRPAFLGVVALAAAVGSWETARAVRRIDAKPPLAPLVAGGALTVALAWWGGPDALTVGLLATVLAALVWRLPDGRTGYGRDATAALLIAVYVPFLAGFAAMLAVPPDGEWRVLVTLAAVVLSDTGGYAVGVFLGKHPMAPTVSPKKSWEGFGGSVVAAAVGSAVLLFVFLDLEPWWGAVFGVAISVAAVLGDLAESMIKRDIGVKDMSRLLPGHGGLMDRLDSVLFAVPTAYLILSILVPPS